MSRRKTDAGGPITTMEMIDRAKAEEYLAVNVGNRRVLESWSDLLAAVILQGGWERTHQGIAFNGDGTLVEGQHRLKAVIKADKQQPGVAVPMRVTRGLDKEA